MSNETKTLEEIKRETEDNLEIQAQRETIKGLKFEIRKIRSDYGNLQGYFRDLEECFVDFPAPEPPRIYSPDDFDPVVESECVAVLHWTDWHMGACQDAEEIEGFNEFSPEILEARIENLVHDFSKWVNTARTAYTINQCVVLDTGDNISGDIHDDLRITNAFPTPVQAFKAGLLKSKSLKELCQNFEQVTIEFLTPDNHGRLTRKPQAKQQGMNTHNYTVGQIAKLDSRNVSNLTFNIHTQHNTVVQALNRNYLLTHGHEVSGWAGFPYYGIDRKVKSEGLERMFEPDNRKFHRVVMGHYHSRLIHPHYIIGPSASGTDALDHKQGRRSIPMQHAWMIHPDHGEYNQTTFKLRVE